MKPELLYSVFAAVIGTTAVPCFADPAVALQRCRLIADTQGRLACYDAITLPSTAVDGVVNPASTAPALAPATTAPAQAAAPPSQGAAATVPVDPNFGLRTQPAPAAQDAVESTFSGMFDGWVSDSKIALANGQVWQINDGSRAAYPSRRDPKVRITRGLLGSFFLEVEGVVQTPRVKRVR